MIQWSGNWPVSALHQSSKKATTIFSPSALSAVLFWPTRKRKKVTNETCFLLLLFYPPPPHHTNNNEARPGVKSFFVSSLFFFFFTERFLYFFLFVSLAVVGLDSLGSFNSISLWFNSIRIFDYLSSRHAGVCCYTPNIFFKKNFINKNDGYYYFDRLSIRWFRALVIHARQTLILPTRDDEDSSLLSASDKDVGRLLDGEQTGSTIALMLEMRAVICLWLSLLPHRDRNPTYKHAPTQQQPITTDSAYFLSIYFVQTFSSILYSILICWAALL